MRRPTTPTPLFICYANCCRSVLAKYLYEHLFPGTHALSAGIAAGGEINDRASAMLQHWGIDAGGHKPRQLDPALCDEADAIFLMGPEYLRRMLESYGEDLAAKAYLFADPFTMPRSFSNGEYLVYDPSFEKRPIPDLANEFSWFRERIVQIHEALCNGRRKLVPAARYLDILNG
jgi:protein-tyrosine-phosphatase